MVPLRLEETGGSGAMLGAEGEGLAKTVSEAQLGKIGSFGGLAFELDVTGVYTSFFLLLGAHIVEDGRPRDGFAALHLVVQGRFLLPQLGGLAS